MASRVPLAGGFPGPRLAGAALVLAPILLVAGAFLLMPFEGGTVEDQVAQIAAAPQRTLVGLNVFFAAWVVAAFAIVAFARLVAARRPALAAWGGGLTLAGTYVSAFWAGISHYERILAALPDRALAVELATAGGEPPVALLFAMPGMVFGWSVLAYGAWRAGVLGPARAVALAATGTLPFWVLGGLPMLMPLPYVGLAVAWVPLGVELLRGPAATPPPADAPPA